MWTHMGLYELRNLEIPIGGTLWGGSLPRCFETPIRSLLGGAYLEKEYPPC